MKNFLLIVLAATVLAVPQVRAAHEMFGDTTFVTVEAPNNNSVWGTRWLTGSLHGDLDFVKIWVYNSVGSPDTVIAAIYDATTRQLIARSVDSVVVSSMSYPPGAYFLHFAEGIELEASTRYWFVLHFQTDGMMVALSDTLTADSVYRAWVYDTLPLDNVMQNLIYYPYSGLKLNRLRMGVYYHDGTQATGATCFDTVCLVYPEAEAAARGGEYLGDGTTCSSPNPCIKPTGACCVGRTCSIKTEDSCTIVGGTYLGDSTTCDGSPCVHATLRYVAMPGATVGGAWVGHWTTIAQVNAGTQSGDTVIFGTGNFRDTMLIVIAGGDSLHRTCYIDSLSYYRGWTGRRVAYLYGSDSVTEWTNIGGHLWQANYVGKSNYVTVWQGDSLLWGQTSVANIDGPGKYYNSGTTITVWLYENANPNNCQMEITVGRALLDMVRSTEDMYGYGQSYVSVVGLGFKYAQTRCVTTDQTLHNAFSHVYFDHCYFHNAAGWGGVNPSLFYTDRAGGGGGVYLNERCRIRACSLGTCYSFMTTAMPQVEDNTHGNGITFYSWARSRVDSCIFFGHQSECAIYFKNAMEGTDGAAVYDTVVYNRFAGDAEAEHIRLWGACHDVIVLGNTFVGGSYGVQIGYGTIGISAWGNRTEGHHKILNNTFYNVMSAIGQYDIEGRGYDTLVSGLQHGNVFKYNVYYNASYPAEPQFSHRLDSTRFWLTIDSNLYYGESGDFTAYCPRWNYDTWSEWQGFGFDMHSTSDVNPLFVAPYDGNFRRTATVAEENQVMDGQTWSLFGAIQGVVSPVSPISSNGLRVKVRK